MREDTKTQNEMIAAGRFDQAADPTQTYHAPEKNDPVPYLDFSALQNALASLETASKTFADSSENSLINSDEANELNKILYQCEQALLIQGGLPRRPWYRHTIYAPGYYTGYGVKTLPGIREAIEQRDWEEARQQIELVSKALQTYTAKIGEATALLTSDKSD